MLLAEIHGKAVPEVEGNEDYLTSSVFGHLRCVHPAVFWETFFSRSIGLPGELREPTLLEFLLSRGVQLSSYTSLDCRFWPTHSLFGTPDLALSFTGRNQRPFVLVIEAKLWASKGGSGENDQLLRYLKLLDRLA